MGSKNVSLRGIPLCSQQINQKILRLNNDVDLLSDKSTLGNPNDLTRQQSSEAAKRKRLLKEPTTFSVLTDKKFEPLLDLKSKLKALGTLTYAYAENVVSNFPSIRCVEHNIVKVTFGKAKGKSEHFIHANRIKFPSPIKGEKTDRPARTYLAGQSPGFQILTGSTNSSSSMNTFSEAEKFLTQGIESGHGLFQFVSRLSHYTTEETKQEKPIITQLRAKLRESANRKTELILGGRYRVTNLEELTERSSNAHPDHAHFYLTVVDTSGYKKNQKPIRIPLTQVGLKFTDKILQPEQILRANTLLEQHNNFIQKPQKNAPQPEPMIMSYAGVGRNATLITFLEVGARIRAGLVLNGLDLDDAMADVILKGREARGPHFIHSDAQLLALREALVNVMVQAVTPGSKLARERGSVETAPQAIDPAPSRPILQTTDAGENATFVKFRLQKNVGEGNGLFHALEATEVNPATKMCSLTDDKVLKVREEVSGILVNSPDHERKMNRNAYDYLTILRQYNPARLEIPAILPQVTNHDLAAVQAHLGSYAGDTEIHQWLAISRNRHKTIIVIDNAQGFKTVTRFTYNKDEKKGTIVRNLKVFNPDADSAVNPGVEEDKLIQMAFNDALAQEKDGIPLADRTHLALLQSESSWDRIVGYADDKEMKLISKVSDQVRLLPNSQTIEKTATSSKQRPYFLSGFSYFFRFTKNAPSLIKTIDAPMPI